MRDALQNLNADAVSIALTENSISKMIKSSGEKNGQIFYSQFFFRCHYTIFYSKSTANSAANFNVIFLSGIFSRSTLVVKTLV